jgi:hypothetical protein
MAKWLKDLYKEYIEEELEENLTSSVSRSTPAVIGGIYFGSLKALDKEKANKPLYFLVLRKMDDNLYEVMKASDWHHFASNTDIFVKLPTITLIIETANNFYLTSEEISKFILIDTLSKEDLTNILKFRRGHKTPELKTGFTPIFKSEDDIRTRFKKEEFNQIKKLHTRIFEFLAEPEE